MEQVSINSISVNPGYTQIPVDKDMLKTLDQDTQQPDIKSVKRQSKSTQRKVNFELSLQPNIQEAMNSNQINNVVYDKVFCDRLDECKNNPYGWPAVNYAINAEYFDVAQYLIESGESVNELTPPTPIHYKNHSGKILGYQKGISAVMLAIMSENVALLKLLLSKNPDLNDSLEMTVNADWLDEAEGAHEIPLWFYTEENELETMDISLFFMAMITGNPEIMDLIANAINH